jgi:hypothetical protein
VGKEEGYLFQNTLPESLFPEASLLPERVGDDDLLQKASSFPNFIDTEIL